MNKNCDGICKKFYYAIYPSYIGKSFKNINKYEGPKIIKAETIEAIDIKEAKKILGLNDYGIKILQVGDSVDKNGQLENVLAEKRGGMWINKKQSIINDEVMK